MAITLSILCFAMVAAIMLVRTRARLAETEAGRARRDHRRRAEVDRVNALLLSEPQILVAWAAATTSPRSSATSRS